MWASKVRGMVQLPPTGMSSSYEYFQESAACFAVLLLPTAATHRNNRKSLSFLQKRSIIFQSASNLRESFEYIKRGEKDISPPFFSFTFLLIQLSVSLFMSFVSARWNFSRLFREKRPCSALGSASRCCMLILTELLWAQNVWCRSRAHISWWPTLYSSGLHTATLSTLNISLSVHECVPMFI